MLKSLHTLLSSVLDYAGLFPPARLKLETAMTNYLQYRSDSHAWMLNQFVLPLSQINQFIDLLPTVVRDRNQPQPWPLSVILPQDLETDQAVTDRSKDLGPSEVIAILHALSQSPIIALKAIECPPLPPQAIQRLIRDLPVGVESFFEIPLNDPLDPYLEVLQHTGASAKVRTGGLTPDAFPSWEDLSRFIFTCAQAHVPFKATAGLHHPFRGQHRLLSASDCPDPQMHGFLNVAIAAALVDQQKVTLTEVGDILNVSGINRFRFLDQGIGWRDYTLNLSELQAARQLFFRSFGSCSVQDPIDQLKELQLL